MQILYGKHYWRQCRPERSSLTKADIERCQEAVRKFIANPRRPGLNFERLGSGSNQNHWSIRASRELRVIIAVEVRGDTVTRAAFVYMGHHNAYDWALRRGYSTDLDAYDWARRRDFLTDLDDSSAVYEPLRRPDVETGRLPEDFEEWMLFLSKTQEKLVNRYHAGAARIRGAAGTGKTVVALHRAAVLGRRYPDSRILVTTFSRSLCQHLKALFRRMPDPPGNVDFRNVDSLANQYLGTPLKLDLEQVKEAFEAAFQAIVPEEARERLGGPYLREEICRVIKGRDATKSEYLDTDRFERLGRIRSFKRADREICWCLREAWDDELRARGTTTFEDRLLEARNHAWETGEPIYRSAIVDEGQDMTLVGVQFVRALVAGKPQVKLQRDSLLILDDTAQRIYPGGYRPRWANLDYGMFSNTLHLNYRNSPKIFQAARAVRGAFVIGKDANDDGAADDVEFERTEGTRPALVMAPRGEDPAVVSRIRALVAKRAYKHEEIAVLVRRNADAANLVESLRKDGVPCVNLKQLRFGKIDRGVRVGTFDRAKGLEFRAVFIARLGRSRFPLEEAERTPGSTEQVTELRQLHLDRLYAAMTRSRDLLCLVADEDPCVEIRRACGRYVDDISAVG